MQLVASQIDTEQQLLAQMTDVAKAKTMLVKQRLCAKVNRERSEQLSQTMQGKCKTIF